MNKKELFPSLFYGIDQKGRLVMTHPMLTQVHVVNGVIKETKGISANELMFSSYALRKQTGHGF